MSKQRARAEILEERNRAVRNATDTNYYKVQQNSTQEAVLEVLMDIRDQINKIHQVMPEASQLETE